MVHYHVNAREIVIKLTIIIRCPVTMAIRYTVIRSSCIDSEYGTAKG